MTPAFVAVSIVWGVALATGIYSLLHDGGSNKPSQAQRRAWQAQELRLRQAEQCLNLDVAYFTSDGTHLRGELLHDWIKRQQTGHADISLWHDEAGCRVCQEKPVEPVGEKTQGPVPEKTSDKKRRKNSGKNASKKPPKTGGKKRRDKTGENDPRKTPEPVGEKTSDKNGRPRFWKIAEGGPAEIRAESGWNIAGDFEVVWPETAGACDCGHNDLDEMWHLWPCPRSRKARRDQELDLSEEPAPRRSAGGGHQVLTGHECGTVGHHEPHWSTDYTRKPAKTWRCPGVPGAAMLEPTPCPGRARHGVHRWFWSSGGQAPEAVWCGGRP